MQTRLSYYASSKRARAILGQRRSTIDMRRDHPRRRRPAGLHRPGNGGQGRGRPGGRVLLNLVDAVIREQGSLPSRAARRAGRRGRDAVDARRGLRVDALGAWASSARPSSWPPRASPSWTTSPAPCGTPCSPTWAASPSSRWRAPTPGTLVWELGKDRVTEDDIVSLPVHHCYVRATVGTERMDRLLDDGAQAGGGRPGVAEPASARRPPSTPSRPSRRTTPTPRATRRWTSTAGELTT